jgi:integral membrane protein
MNKYFTAIGRLEGVSFLTLLFIAMPIKYGAQDPYYVQLLGPIHGFLFLAYCSIAFYLAFEQKWPIKKHLLAYAAAVFPFGTFMFEKRYRN